MGLLGISQYDIQEMISRYWMNNELPNLIRLQQDNLKMMQDIDWLVRKVKELERKIEELSSDNLN